MSADAPDAAQVAIPAATVVLLRDGPRGIETLMLRRDAALVFAGGVWVFPGGRIDPVDYPEGVHPDVADDETVLDAARRAAVREAAEEAGLALHTDTLVWFAHWTPATATTRKFATWFFAARAPDGAVVIDDGEIRAHEWATPADAIERHRSGEVSLLPPTWVTLDGIQRSTTVDEHLAALSSRPPVHYVSKIVQDRDGVTVSLWAGDAGYETGEPDRPGRRHRLWMRDDGWELEETEG